MEIPADPGAAHGHQTVNKCGKAGLVLAAEAGIDDKEPKQVMHYAA